MRMCQVLELFDFAILLGGNMAISGKGFARTMLSNSLSFSLSPFAVPFFPFGFIQLSFRVFIFVQTKLKRNSFPFGNCFEWFSVAKISPIPWKCWMQSKFACSFVFPLLFHSLSISSWFQLFCMLISIICWQKFTGRIINQSSKRANKFTHLTANAPNDCHCHWFYVKPIRSFMSSLIGVQH